MKSYMGKQQFSGGYEEDLNNFFQLFETLVTICQVTETEMKIALRIILKGDELYLYSGRSGECDTYTKANEMLQSWYNSEEKRNRILE